MLCGTRDYVVKAAELDSFGVPRSTVSRQCRPGGGWQRLLPGVLLLRSGHPTAEQKLTAALLYAGADAVLTGGTALALYGMRSAPTSSVHLLVPHEQQPATVPGLVVERTRRMPKQRTMGTRPCATVARAAMDAARRCRQIDDVRAILAEVVQRRLTTVSALAEELRLAPSRGTALPRKVLAEVAEGVRSVAEARANLLVAKSGLPQPVWNRAVCTSDGQLLGTPDAVWLELGVVLEIDSLEWHLGPAEWKATQARRARFAGAGVVVVPVVPSQLEESPDDVLAALRGALDAAAGRPSLGLRFADGSK